MENTFSLIKGIMRRSTQQQVTFVSVVVVCSSHGLMLFMEKEELFLMSGKNMAGYPSMIYAWLTLFR